MTLPHHLVTVWNPSYAQDAMDEQVRAGTETHLYLTGYRSLYVAWVGEITAEHLPKEQPEELDHMPSYYRDQFADFWFQLWDIRRLVADDTPAVTEELKRLRNTRYHDRPVSLYGGMVELPLIVTREDGASWFSDRDVLTDGQLWAQREAELRGEAELNALLMPAMRKVLSGKSPSDRSVLLDGRTLDLGLRIPPQSRIATGWWSARLRSLPKRFSGRPASPAPPCPVPSSCPSPSGPARPAKYRRQAPVSARPSQGVFPWSALRL